MNPATLHEHQSRLLGALTLATVQRLGGDTVCLDAENHFRNWRMARVDDVVLIDQAADETAPRSINCYIVEVEEIDASSQLAEHGKKFKVDPSCLLFALRWLDRGEPPDLDLTLVRDPTIWFDRITMLLFGALNRQDPHLFDSMRAGLNCCSVFGAVKVRGSSQSRDAELVRLRPRSRHGALHLCECGERFALNQNMCMAGRGRLHERNPQFYLAGHSATRILHDAAESSCSKMRHTRSQLTMLCDSRG
jgi:hypothetical protein